MEILMSALFNTDPRMDLGRQETQDIPKPDKVEEKDGKYDADIGALIAEVGKDDLTGICIELPLRRLLEIIPRKRRRSDAYNGLKRKLKEKYNCELTFKH